MEALELPEDVNAAYILQLLARHDWDDFSPALRQKARETLAPDEHGTITLDARTKTFTLNLRDGKFTNTSTWTREMPHTFFHDLRGVPGTLYTAPHGDLPSGRNGCWIQQHRGRDGHVGRTVIEFWSRNVLTGLFKTNNENYGASGHGTWVLRS